MLRNLAAFLAAFFMYGCGQNVTLPKEKAEFAKSEIEKIAREYAPIADKAFADESVELRVKRAELRTRLYTILELVGKDVSEDSRADLVRALLRASLILMGAPQ